MPFDLANPVWIDDDDIDLDYHVRYMVLPKPGSIEQLEALAARLHSMLLDRSRPLWESTSSRGSPTAGSASTARSITPRSTARPASRWRRACSTSRPSRGRQAAARSARQHLPARRRRAARRRAAPTRSSSWCKASSCCRRSRAPPSARRKEAIATRRSESKEDRAARKAEAPPSRFKLAPPTPFNHSITNQRAFAAVSLPLPEIKAIGKAVGASINDVVLWLCSTALRSYLKEGRELPDKSLVAGVPISLRQEGDTTANNQVAGTLVDLGTELADPVARLKAIKRGTAAMKKEMGTFRGVIPTDFPSLGSPWLISGLASLYGRSRIADWLRIANVTISNVPGSRVPVYLCGAKMTDYYPLSIVVHGIALNITVQSHVDQLCFGLIACRRAVPDVHELGNQLQRAMATLRALVAPAVAGGGRARRLRTRCREGGAARRARAARQGEARARAAAPRVVAPAARRAAPRPRRAGGEGRASPASRRRGALKRARMRLARRCLRRPGGAAPPLLPRPRDVPLGQAARPEDVSPQRRRGGGVARCSPPTRASTTAFSPPASPGASRWARAGTSIKVFFLGCVIVAGVYGAATVGKKILFVQALPAAIALALVLVAY